MAGGPSAAVLRVIERSALALGMAAALVVAAAVGSRWVAQGEARPLASEATVVQADVREWEPKRVRAWRDALKRMGPAPLATLQIRRIGVDVAVLRGDRRLDPEPRRRTHRRHAEAGRRRQRRPGRTSRRILPPPQGHRRRRPHRGRDRRTGRSVSGDADVDRHSQRRVGARPHRVAVADARDLLPVLLHRFRAEAVHRPCGARRRHRNSAINPVGEGGSDACL